MESILLEQGKQIIEPLFRDAFQWVFNTTGRQIAYARDYEKSVTEIKDKQLANSWVQAEADKAILEGEEVRMGKVNKLKDGEKPLMAKAEKVLHEFDERKGFTCCGPLPNYWRRYRVGRMAKKCIKEIEEFRTNKGPEILGVETLPGEVGSLLNSIKPNACELQTRVAVMNEIIHLLEDDTNQRIGVWGPEGAGKSMLINQVLSKVNKQKLHQCVRVQVPPSADEEKIQELILKEISPNLHVDKMLEVDS